MITLFRKLRTAFATKDRLPQDNSSRSWLQTVLITSVGVTILVLGVRHLKWLQTWELAAYDQMIRLRPAEPPDPHLLLVTITEEDLGSQDFSLPDEIINRLLIKIQSYQPRVIGLSIDRSKQKNLGAGLQNLDNVITYCTFSSMGSPEIPPPPNFPIDQVGFSDVISDDEDVIVRRSLLFAASNDKKCQTKFSFAALLAIHYLERQGIKSHFTDLNHFYIGKNLFPRLSEDAGGYENIDAAGYQILLNYRDPSGFAKQVTLTEVLEGKVDANWIKDRLVIIGTTARSVHPGFYTPYSGSSKYPQRIPPVYIHAQVASQIISTVLSDRHLIWYLPNWAEAVWVWGWSIVGGVLAWQLRYPLRLGLAGSVSLGSLVGVCYLLFLQGAWLPVIPPAVTLVLSGVSVMAYSTYQTQQQTKIIVLQVEKQKEAIEQLNTLLKETTRIYDKHVHSGATVDNTEKATGDFILGGRYQINKVLGSGGFGCTYLAKDNQRPGNPICVVKQLMPARRDTRFMQVARRLFDAEAEILEVLGKHHQIPELLAYFEESNEFYLVQEYISGHALSEELPPHHNIKTESEVIEMLKGILEVLAFVHEHRVIHRDIKPSNIIRCDTDNRLVLIDFGAVKMMQPQSSEQTELATVAIGTRGYAPPEQFAGHPRLSSDIYALGMIAIQAITGIPPHELHPHPETGTVEWRYGVKISNKLAEILDKMVRYHFSDRYQSAAEVLQDLQKIE
ncbi:MAG: serine/threonine protein kinase [Fischerella sp.]|nr:MAG: serine/threonine protein kinase [Fischerella sp.]